MDDTMTTTSAATDSPDTRPFPKQTPVIQDLEPSQNATCSDESSSIQTLGSSSLNGFGGNLLQATVCDMENNSALPTESEESDTARGGTAVGRDVSAGFEHRLSNELRLSATLQPEAHSTPLKEVEEEEVEEEESVSAGSEEESYSVASGDNDRELFLPGDLFTPIQGYETMEARPKFTVYKIHVQKIRSEMPPTSWFVFRRYSDFIHLNDKLKQLFPAFQLALPPKRWFRDNFDKEFLDSRRLGLQLFLDNIIGHRDICNSEPVRDFFCTDDPPGPHDSLEESRALCDLLEESVYNLRQELQGKNSEIDLLKEELGLYRSRVELLTKQLRLLNMQKNAGGVSTSASWSVDDLDTFPVHKSELDGQRN